MSEGLQTNPVKIAFADDHTTVRTTITSFLESQGSVKVIIEAENGRILSEKIAASEEKPSLCIIDIMMPGMNGFETVATLRKKWTGMKFLVLSGHLREEYVIKMILAGANGFLTKSCHPKEIIHAIHIILREGLYSTDTFSHSIINAVQNQVLKLPQLTEMEVRLLRLCVSDLTYQEIAERMHTTAKSVEGYRNKLFAKLGVKSKVGLAIYAIKNGYVSLESDEDFQ